MTMLTMKLHYLARADTDNVCLGGNDFNQLKLDDNADNATALSSQSRAILTIYSIVNCPTGGSNHMHLSNQC